MQCTKVQLTLQDKMQQIDFHSIESKRRGGRGSSYRLVSRLHSKSMSYIQSGHCFAFRNARLFGSILWGRKRPANDKAILYYVRQKRSVHRIRFNRFTKISAVPILTANAPIPNVICTQMELLRYTSINSLEFDFLTAWSYISELYNLSQNQKITCIKSNCPVKCHCPPPFDGELEFDVIFSSYQKQTRTKRLLELNRTSLYML